MGFLRYTVCPECGDRAAIVWTGAGLDSATERLRAILYSTGAGWFLSCEGHLAHNRDLGAGELETLPEWPPAVPVE
jgi:hypothetical protein